MLLLIFVFIYYKKQSTRKLIFMGIVALSVLCYVGFYTVPSVPAYKIPHQPSYIFSKVNGICDKKLTVLS